MRLARRNLLGLTLLLAMSAAARAQASAADEFKIKRAEVFSFTEKPSVTRAGDSVEIAFESKGYCDVTVAVENAEGRIVRHLASGVLGANAPEPFQKGSLKQIVHWDGKDDEGSYLDDKDRLTIRVSLGLNPRFEKSLLWEPKRRFFTGHGTAGYTTRLSMPTPLIRSSPEGVYVFDGGGVDHLWLFDHEGEYKRTIYPFPADKVEQVQGLHWQSAPQDGRRLPLKTGHVLGTFLTSGPSSCVEKYNTGMFGTAATALAVRNGRVALAFERLNRIASDGSASGLPLEGPAVSFPIRVSGMNRREEEIPVGPTSAAFSPDGKWLYLAGYLCRDGRYGIDLNKDGLQGVVRLAYDGQGPAEIFAGSMKVSGAGSDDQHFTDPVSVDCDTKGRVYVADFMNDRIQVFSPEGKLLKSISVKKPAQVRVHQRTNELYVFSWTISNDHTLGAASNKKEILIPPTLTHLGPFENPQVKATHSLAPFLFDVHTKYDTWDIQGGLQYHVDLDSWTELPTFWLVPGMPGWEKACIRILVEKNGKLELKRDFSEDIKKTMLRAKPPMMGRQRLYVDAQHEKLYVEDGRGHHKSFKDLLEVDPESGKTRLVPLPFDAEDMAIDLHGQAYLRTDYAVARYDTETWREIPFDYGVEMDAVGFLTSAGPGWAGGKKASVISGIPIYMGSFKWHSGGMYISTKGRLVISCYASKAGNSVLEQRTDEAKTQAVANERYVSRLYPGKVRLNEIHVWDTRGKRVYEDFLPGLAWSRGLGMDRDDNLYVMARPTRVLDGKPYFNLKSCTLMKARPQSAKVISTRPAIDIPVPETARPKRPFDLFDTVQGEAWVEGADWMYGGVGYDGKGVYVSGGGCSCWNSTFALDHYARSFAPEVDHYSVAVLDSNGNLILRVGRYGNEDSGGPKSLVPLGGDGVGLFYPNYVATHTDRRLFITDPGNERIVSVTLGYHAEERVPLKNVRDTLQALGR